MKHMCRIILLVLYCFVSHEKHAKLEYKMLQYHSSPLTPPPPKKKNPLKLPAKLLCEVIEVMVNEML